MMSENRTPGQKKGQPTPSRKEQEQARIRPLVGNRSKEAKQAERLRIRSEREKARVGMMAGDDRYLTLRDRGPQRKYVRDLVDARFTAGELVLPGLFVVILATFINSEIVQIVSLLSMWGLFGIVAVDAWFVSRMVKKRVASKFGADRLESGLGWYGAMRSIQMRALRIPKPQVARFTKLDK
jgi:hypothetical protein